MTKKDVKALKKSLKLFTLESLEKWSEEWFLYDYTPNPWESQYHYIKRKNIVLPLIIKEKLKRNEQEYRL